VARHLKLDSQKPEGKQRVRVSHLGGSQRRCSDRIHGPWQAEGQLALAARLAEQNVQQGPVADSKLCIEPVGQGGDIGQDGGAVQVGDKDHPNALGQAAQQGQVWVIVLEIQVTLMLAAAEKEGGVQGLIRGRDADQGRRRLGRDLRW